MRKLSYGWVVVAVGGFTTCIATGALMSLPVFILPIAADTGWSRAGIGVAITLNFLLMGISSFVWGNLSDRYGPRVVLLAGICLLCAGLAAVSRATDLLVFQLIYGGLIGVAGGSTVTPLISTVTLWFDRHRAMAVSLVSSGIAVAPMTMSPAATWLIQEYGWRQSEVILAVAVGVILLPLTYFIRRPPHLPPAAAAPGGNPHLKADAARAFRSRPFIVMSVTFFFCCATHSGPILHTVSYALGCGLSAMTAVSIYSVEGFAGLVGRLCFGALADRLGVKRMVVAGLLVQAFAAGAYGMVSTRNDFYVVAFVFGLAYGGVMPLYAALARSFFPPHIMGTVLGAMTMASGVGMALGPAIGGWIYDTYHAYTWMYVGSLAVGLAAAAVATLVPRAEPAVPNAAAIA